MKYIILLLFIYSLPVRALDVELKGSMAGKSGNTNSSSQLFKSKVTTVFKANTLSSGMAYSRDSKDHITYSEAYKLYFMNEYKFTDPHGAYIKYEFYRDTFRGYRAQHKTGAGHLFYWNKYFKTRTGYKYYEERDHFVAGYILNYEIFESKLDYVRASSLDYEVLANFALKFKVFSYFSLEFDYEYTYNSFNKTDSKYYTMLVVNF